MHLNAHRTDNFHPNQRATNNGMKLWDEITKTDQQLCQSDKISLF